MNDVEQLTPERPRQPLSEARAEELLEDYLADPQYRFLSENPHATAAIESAETSVQALEIARNLIVKRIEAAVVFDGSAVDNRFKNVKVNAATILRTLDSISKNSLLIGEGKDAIVVIDKNEIKEFPPEVCYKFAKLDKTPRGRNSIAQEAEVQQLFYDVLYNTETKIGIPQPFYALDTGSEKMFVMEKLPAVSIDEINRGLKELPDWVDVEDLCNELEAVIDLLHHNRLYHRDLHPGNVMISVQKPENPEDKIAYIIDFGLSGKGDEIDPYRKENAEGVFTYGDDCVMVKDLRLLLRQVQQIKLERNDYAQ